MVIDLDLEADAPFVGREVRAIGLPAGCVLIRSTENGREFVSTAYTYLEPPMRMIDVNAPEATEGLKSLQRGCKATKNFRGHFKKILEDETVTRSKLQAMYELLVQNTSYS